MTGSEAEEIAGIEVFETKPHHNCGVAAVISDSPREDISFLTTGLLAQLQHRGPDGAGVAVIASDPNEPEICTSELGSVSQVLKPSNIQGLPTGVYSTGHVRYPTQGLSGSGSHDALQPMIGSVDEQTTFWVAANGQFGFSPLELDQYPSDTKKFVEIVAQQLASSGILHKAVVEALSLMPPNSAYSMTIMDKNGVLAVRDPWGIHPLFAGYSSKYEAWMVASETPALTNMAVHDLFSIPPGHFARFVAGETPKIEAFVKNPITTPKTCGLETIYFARADGMIEGRPIYEASKDAGRILASYDRDLDFDIVVPVPDSARAAAQGYAEHSGKLYTEGFVRIGSQRSFTQADPKLRQQVADHKLQIIPSQITGKRIVLVEDSIVRGTTLRKLVERLKKFGALEVHLRIASPPVKDTCTYGIDIPTKEELIYNRKKGDIAAICAELGADSLRYLTVEESRQALGGRLGRAACMKCFTGRTPKDNFVYRIPIL